MKINGNKRCGLLSTKKTKLYVTYFILGFSLSPLLHGQEAKRFQSPWSVHTRSVHLPKDPNSKRVTLDELSRKTGMLEKNQNWDALLSVLQDMSSNFGNSLIRVTPRSPIDNAFERFVNVNEFVRETLMANPELLTLFQTRNDAIAESKFKKAKAEQNSELLQEIVDRFYCTHSGDLALEFLGDLNFAHGNFGQALSIYRKLVPSRFKDPLTVEHPTPSIDPALVRAKRILTEEALALRDRGSEPDREDLRPFSESLRRPEIDFAGRKGKDILASVREALDTDSFRPESENQTWTNFSGSYRGNRLMRAQITDPKLLKTMDLNEPEKKVVASSTVSRTGARNYYTPTRAARIVSGQSWPSVVGSELWFQGREEVKVLDLEKEAGPTASTPSWKAPAPLAYDYLSVAVSGDEAVVVSAADFKSPPAAARAGAAYRYTPPVVRTFALSLISKNSAEKLVWTRTLVELLPEETRANFQPASFATEGAPLFDGNHIFVAFYANGTSDASENHFLASLDRQGNAVWIRSIGEVRKNMGDNNNFGFAAVQVNNFSDLPSRAKRGVPLLTLDAGSLLYASNSGMIASVEAETGRALWVTLYPGAQNSENQALNAPVSEDGVTVIAPSDSRRILSFREDNGRILWATPQLGVDENRFLIGAHRNRIFVTRSTGVSSFNLDTGEAIHTDRVNDLTNLQTKGRGLLTADRILWPTNEGVFALDQQTLTQVDPSFAPKEVVAGDLIATAKYLISLSGNKANIYTFK